MAETVEELEDSPAVKKLKELDDKYLELRREYDREREELATRYSTRQKEFLLKRKGLLCAATENGPKSGTPALTGFWCKALQHHEAFEDKIRPWDEPVLEYLSDIELEPFHPHVKGFKLIFRFVENPYFSNKELFVEYHTAEDNAYLDSLKVEKIVSSPIEWNAGKDVTVEKVTKKGKKPKSGKKEQERSRPSFFREFICNLHQGTSLEEIKEFFEGQMEEADLRGNSSQMLTMLMENHHEVGCALRDNVIPFAVRWYTGEACVDDGSDDDDDEEEEEEDSEEDNDSEDEDESTAPAPVGGRGGASSVSGPGRGKKSSKTSPKGSPELKPSEQPKEDCKQQ